MTFLQSPGQLPGMKADNEPDVESAYICGSTKEFHIMGSLKLMSTSRDDKCKTTFYVVIRKIL